MAEDKNGKYLASIIADFYNLEYRSESRSKKNIEKKEADEINKYRSKVIERNEKYFWEIFEATGIPNPKNIFDINQGEKAARYFFYDDEIEIVEYLIENSAAMQGYLKYFRGRGKSFKKALQDPNSPLKVDKNMDFTSQDIKTRKRNQYLFTKDKIETLDIKYAAEITKICEYIMILLENRIKDAAQIEAYRQLLYLSTNYPVISIVAAIQEEVNKHIANIVLDMVCSEDDILRLLTMLHLDVQKLSTHWKERNEALSEELFADLLDRSFHEIAELNDEDELDDEINEEADRDRLVEKVLQSQKQKIRKNQIRRGRKDTKLNRGSRHYRCK